MEYEIKENGDGSLNLVCGHHTLAKIYFKGDHVASPITKDKAEEWMNTIKCMVETEYPVAELDESEYGQSELGKFLESLDDEELKVMAFMTALRCAMD